LYLEGVLLVHSPLFWAYHKLFIVSGGGSPFKSVEMSYNQGLLRV